MTAILSPREPPLPPEAAMYRALGPFTVDTIPKGLWREHNLKADVWALLTVLEGRIHFCWDDASGGAHLLETGAQIMVPPIIPHHLEQVGPVAITLSFWALPETHSPAAT